MQRAAFTCGSVAVCNAAPLGVTALCRSPLQESIVTVAVGPFLNRLDPIVEHVFLAVIQSQRIDPSPDFTVVVLSGEIGSKPVRWLGF